MPTDEHLKSEISMDYHKGYFFLRNIRFGEEGRAGTPCSHSGTQTDKGCHLQLLAVSVTQRINIQPVAGARGRVEHHGESVSGFTIETTSVTCTYIPLS